MLVELLGTGAADGWPNPFCGCASCAAQRRAGVHRVATSALVDRTLLLDVTSEGLHRASSFGIDLADVGGLLVTHAHPDHLAPVTLLWRRWARRTRPGPAITVAGPTPVTDEVQRWFGGDPQVLAVTLRPGDVRTVGPHTVRALAAEHEVPTLLYDVTGPDGSRLLYATDSGPLPETTLAATAGRAYDLVLLEETFGHLADHGTGHHDLTSFPVTLAALRATGAVGAGTRVVAVHLSHHNPPEPELADTLAAWGAEPGRDGQALDTRPAQAAADGRAQPGRASRRTLLTGGVRSGKSALAERMLAGEPTVEYVATGGDRRDDAEWRARVAAHQARRPARWSTRETVDLVPLLRGDGPALLIDCLTLWLTDAMDRVGAWDRERFSSSGAADLQARVDDLVSAWRDCPRRVVAVTNEVGSGVVPAHRSGRVFRDELGRLNQRLAEVADEVVLVVAGHPLRIR